MSCEFFELFNVYGNDSCHVNAVYDSFYCTNKLTVLLRKQVCLHDQGPLPAITDCSTTRVSFFTVTAVGGHRLGA